MTYVGLLRGVNVGGARPLPMRDLVTWCVASGFEEPRTYIQSGNVVFKTRRSAGAARRVLEEAIAKHYGRPVDVVVTSANDLATVVDANPFPDADPARVLVHFSTEPVPAPVFEGVKGPAGERVVCAERVFYVHYPEGQGRSKLKLPRVPGAQTARNLNTLRALVAMAVSVK